MAHGQKDHIVAGRRLTSRLFGAHYPLLSLQDSFQPPPTCSPSVSTAEGINRGLTDLAPSLQGKCKWQHSLSSSSYYPPHWPGTLLTVATAVNSSSMKLKFSLFPKSYTSKRKRRQSFRSILGALHSLNTQEVEHQCYSAGGLNGFYKMIHRDCDRDQIKTRSLKPLWTNFPFLPCLLATFPSLAHLAPTQKQVLSVLWHFSLHSPDKCSKPNTASYTQCS